MAQKRFFRISCYATAVSVTVLLAYGCTITRPIAKGATQHNRAVHDSINRALLLNILRAADREPKTFTSVSGITGKGSASPGPSFSIGLSTDSSDKLSLPFPLNGSTAAFSVKVHESKEFAQGLFDPISMEQLLHFWNQGWSRTMILMLAVGSVEVSEEPCKRLTALGLPTEETSRVRNDGVTIIGCKAKYWNRPQRGLEDAKRFAAAVAFLVDDERVSIQPRTTFSVEAEAATLADVEKLASLAGKPGYSVSRAENDKTNVYQRFLIQKQVPAFSLALGDDKNQWVPFGESRKTDESTLSIAGSIRSTEGLIHYIGQIHRYQEPGNPFRIPDPDPDEPDVTQTCSTRALFEVAQRRTPRNSALVSVKHRGHQYSIKLVPRTEMCPPMTGTILSFLRQAFALNSSDTDTPSPGLVLVGVDG